MHLKAISDLLIELGIGQLPGDEKGLPPVFIHQADEVINQVPTILIVDEFGGVPVNSELAGYYRTSPQIIVAANRIQQGEDLANRIFRELRATNLASETLTIKELRPKHMPMRYRKSEGKTYEFSTNYFYVFVTE